MHNLIRCAAYSAVMMLLCGALAADDRSDISEIKNRILQPLLEQQVDAERVGRLLKAMQSDGSWGDIDYHDQTRSDVWKPPRHLTNLTLLALAYESPRSSLRNGAEVRHAVLAGLDYWLMHDFQNPNWWHNSIGVPQRLGPILLLLDGELSARQRSKGLEILQRGNMRMTGQNLVWLAEITLVRGILSGDSQLVDSAFGRIAAEIRITGQEGIQPDFSFHQHGPCLYNHGYGADFAVDCSRLAGLAAGTRFAFPRKQVDLLSSYLLDGCQWMAFGGAEDYGADGREIARPGQTAEYQGQAAGDLLKLPTGRENELRALTARIADRTAAPLAGNRCFWRSDFMTHLRKDYYASARMYSTRTLNTDHTHLGEGLKSHYIADGCNFLFTTGREYDDIFPLWDWQKIPGATVEQNGLFPGSPQRRGTTDFVGGVSDGQYGAAAFELQHGSLQARKAWFFFDREYVCLGAGINCNSQSRVLTTVNQCYLRGPVATFVGSAEESPSQGEHRLASPLIVHHDNVAYLIQSPADVMLRNASQQGSWSEISSTLSHRAVCRDVFTLCIDHGKAPHSAAYSYIVCPGVGKQQAREYARAPDVEVLSNAPDLQAVRQRKLRLVQIAFYRPGKLAIDGKTTVETDNPCLLMIQHVEDGIRLSVADPTQNLQGIHVKLSARLNGEESKYDPAGDFSTVSLTLPAGLHAGQSVVRTFSCRP